MRTISAKMILFKKEKTVMTRSRIGHVWLMNNINWPVRALSTREVVKKVLKNGKNDILHIELGHIGKTYSKRVISMVDDIDTDLSKIYFYESCISLKIMQNPSKKSISEVITRLGKIHIDLWKPSLDISLKENYYMWTATDQATEQVWTEFRPNKK